jgi:cell division protein FtsB
MTLEEIKKYNKKIYTYPIIILFTILWMLFWDSHNLSFQGQLQDEIDELNNKIEFYNKEAQKNKAEYKSLNNDKKALEKFARENFYMKKKNEDIYIVNDTISS